MRTTILGLGSYVPPRVVTNDDLRYFDDHHVRQEEPHTETSDAWIQKRTGIVERRYVDNDGQTGCSDLAVEAAKRAIEDAGIEAQEIDCIILGTLSPDIHFPGTAVFVQSKLGIDGENGCACYDIRQQCSAFVYGMEMANAFIKTGLYKKVLLIGSEVHSHSLDFSTRGRDVMVLFGDAAGAVVLGASEEAGDGDGVLYTHVGADGSGAWDLYLKAFEIAHVPYLWLDYTKNDDHLVKYPQMNGKKVFLNAVRAMVGSANRALEKTGLTWDEIDWFVPHQANLRINEAVAQYAEIPSDKVLNSIQHYGNTTAATIPLTIDHHRKAGTVKKGDLILATVFGAGFTWGSTVFRL